MPASKIAAPNPAQEQRDAALFPGKSKLQFETAPALDFAPAPNIVVTAPSRKRDNVFGRKDDKSDEHSANPKEKEGDDAAKRWDQEKNGDPTDPRRMKESGRFSKTEVERAQNLKSETLDAMGRPKLSNDLNPGRREGRDRDAGYLSSDFKSRLQMDWGRPENDHKSFFDRPNSLTPAGAPGASTDPLRGLAWKTPGANNGFSTSETGRGERFLDKPDSFYGNTGSGASTYHVNVPGGRDAKAPSAGSGYFQQGTYTPAAAPPKRNAPAVLEFPKRPGDVLR